MSQVPEIKAEVNKESEKDKKKAGLLGRLFGGSSEGGALGSGSMGGMGGMGGGGFGGLLGGGGLLATKAGLIALILVGTTVAGGIGLVGYRLFGPGQDSGGGDNLSVFAPKPKEAQGSGVAPVAADGSSQSLGMFSQANAVPKAPDAAPAEAPKDATAANAAADASAASSKGAINAAGNSGNGVNKGLAKEGKFGKLTSSFGGSGALSGGGGSSAVANSGKTAAELAAAAASRNGTLGAMKKGAAESGGGRSIAARRSNRALGQAFSALKDGRGAATSYGAGKTFDGSAATSGGNTGPEGGAIGAAPAGTTDGGQPKALPANQNSDSKEFKAPPVPNATMAAPWQGAINSAQMMLALGGVLCFIMSKIKNPVLFYILGAIVAALALAIVALGGMIAGGQWGQKLQGGVLAAAGVGLGIAATMALVSGPASSTTTTGSTTVDPDTGVTTTTSTGADGATTTTTADGAGNSTTTQSGGGMFGGINPYVLVGGGAALVGIATCQLKPPEKHPASDFENGKVPDAGFFGYQQLPSEKALKDMLA